MTYINKTNYKKEFKPTVKWCSPDMVDAWLFLSYGYNVVDFKSKFKDAKVNYSSLKSLNRNDVNNLLSDQKYQEIFTSWNNSIRNILSHSEKAQPTKYQESKDKLIKFIKEYQSFYTEKIRDILLSVNKNILFDKINSLFDLLIGRIESDKPKYKDIQLVLLLSISFFLYKHELKNLWFNLTKFNFFDIKINYEKEVLETIEKIIDQESMKHSEIDKIYIDQLETWNLASKIKNNEIEKISIKEIFHILNLLLNDNVDYNSSKKNFYEKFKLDTNQNEHKEILDYQKLDPKKIYFIKNNSHQFKLMFRNENNGLIKGWVKYLEDLYQDSQVLESDSFKNYKDCKVKWFTLIFSSKNIFNFLSVAQESKNGENISEKIIKSLEKESLSRNKETLDLAKKIIKNEENLYEVTEGHWVKPESDCPKIDSIRNDDFIKNFSKLILSKIVKMIKTEENALKMSSVYDNFYLSFFPAWQSNNQYNSQKLMDIIVGSLNKQELIRDNEDAKFYIDKIKDKDYKEVYEELVSEKISKKKFLLQQQNIKLKTLSSNFIYNGYSINKNESLNNSEILNLILEKISNKNKKQNNQINYSESENKLIIDNKIIVKNIQLPFNLNEISILINILLDKDNNFNQNWQFNIDWKKSISNNSIIYLHNYDQKYNQKYVNFCNKINDLSKFILILKENRENEKYRFCANSVFHSRLLKTNEDFSLFKDVLNGKKIK